MATGHCHLRRNAGHEHLLAAGGADPNKMLFTIFSLALVSVFLTYSDLSRSCRFAIRRPINRTACMRFLQLSCRNTRLKQLKEVPITLDKYASRNHSDSASMPYPLAFQRQLACRVI